MKFPRIQKSQTGYKWQGPSSYEESDSFKAIRIQDGKPTNHIIVRTLSRSQGILDGVFIVSSGIYIHPTEEEISFINNAPDLKEGMYAANVRMLRNGKPIYFTYDTGVRVRLNTILDAQAGESTMNYSIENIRNGKK